MIGPASSLLTSRSMSLTVSRRRRRLPHAELRMTPGIAPICSSSARRQSVGEVDADALADLAEERDPFENLLLRLAAEAFLLGDLAGIARGLQLLDRVDLQVLEEELHLLRLRGREAAASRRRRPGSRSRRLSRNGSSPVVTSVVIFSRSVSPMPRNVGEFLLLDEFVEVAFELADGAGAVVIGVACGSAFALEFEQRADLVQSISDFIFGHGAPPLAVESAE